ncbi:hypothetical protein DP68_08875 [Clostridium sp. HMP27]|nr:hypothetical protein DP68_08875 [Clostridium sp. HMP27]
MKDLERCFKQAKRQGACYIGVVIEMDGFEKPEVIVNSYENFQSKLEYYRKTYDEDCNHKYSKGIKLIACNYAFEFNQLEEDFIYILNNIERR